MSLLGQLTPQQWQNAPASPPPPGVLSNFIDPPSHRPEIIALEGVFLSLMLMAVAVRIFVRLRVIKTWGWDDCKISSFMRVIVWEADRKQIRA